MAKIPLFSLNSGEITPELHHRSDLAKYRSALKVLENFLVLPQGSLKRRRGSEVLCRTIAGEDARIIPWEVNRTEYYILVMTNLNIDIYSHTGELIQTGIATPYTTDDLREVYPRQVFDEMYLAHSDYPLKKLARTTNDTWIFYDVTITKPPMIEIGSSENVLSFDSVLLRVSFAEPTLELTDVGRTIRARLDLGSEENIYLKITHVDSSQVADVQLVSGTLSTAGTPDWGISAFSETTGYSSAVEIYQERLVLAGSRKSPASVYFSRTNSWEDFEPGTLATSSLSLTMTTDLRAVIRWFSIGRDLMIGTDSGEWTIGADGGPLTGTSLTIARHSLHGSEPIQPSTISNQTMYIEAGGRRLMSFANQPQYGQNYYESQDMSILAAHLTKNTKIKRSAVTRSPEPILWVITEDGQLFSYTHNARHEVNAWARHPMSGSVIDIATVMTNDGDDIILTVERSAGTYIEVIHPDSSYLDWSKNFPSLPPESFYFPQGDEDFKVFIKGRPALSYEALTMNEAVIIMTDTPISQRQVLIDGNEVDESRVKTDYKCVFVEGISDKTRVQVLDNGVAATDCQLYNLTEVEIISVSPGISITETASIIELAHDQYLKLDTDPFVTELEDHQYSINPIRSTIWLSNVGAVEIGIPYTSQFETVDIFNHPESGGPGGKSRVNEVEIFLTDSVGGEVTTGDSDRWQEIPYTNKNGTVGEALNLFTGKKEVRLNRGHSDQQSIKIRNRSTSPMTVVALGITGNKVKS